MATCYAPCAQPLAAILACLVRPSVPATITPLYAFHAWDAVPPPTGLYRCGSHYTRTGLGRGRTLVCTFAAATRSFRDDNNFCSRHRHTASLPVGPAYRHLPARTPPLLWFLPACSLPVRYQRNILTAFLATVLVVDIFYLVRRSVTAPPSDAQHCGYAAAFSVVRRAIFVCRRLYGVAACFLLPRLLPAFSPTKPAAPHYYKFLYLYLPT